MEIFAHIGGAAARHGVRPRRQSARLHRRHGPLPGQPAERRSRSSPTRPTALGSRSSTNSRMRFADDLDIAPDGRIFFSEATIRYEMHEWPVDCLEARGNGRIICFDPRDKSTRTVMPNLQFPNGICMHLRRPVDPVRRDLGLPHQPLLVRRAEGRASVEIVHRRTCRAIPTTSTAPRTAITGWRWSACARLPSIWRCGCRASAAAWCNRIPPDEWLYPEHEHRLRVQVRRRRQRCSTACGILAATNHPMITSMREHQGYPLYRRHPEQPHRQVALPGADPELGRGRILLGSEAVIGRDPQGLGRSARRRRGMRSRCRRWMAR